MKTQFKNIVTGTLLVGSLCICAQTHALMIDDYTVIQQALDKGGDKIPTISSSILNSGTNLKHISRTFTVLASSDAAQNEDAISVNNYLQISNTPTSTGFARIDYNFDSIDFTATGTALLLKVVDIDLGGVTITMSVNNGPAEESVEHFADVGDLVIPFASFANPSQFKHATHLRLDFKSIKPAWDGQFAYLATDTHVDPTPPVPENSTLGLMSLSLGLVALGFQVKKLNENQNNA